MPDLYAGLGAALDEKAWLSLLEDDENLANELATTVAQGLTAEDIFRYMKRRTANDRIASWYRQAANHLVRIKNTPLVGDGEIGRPSRKADDLAKAGISLYARRGD